MWDDHRIALLLRNDLSNDIRPDGPLNEHRGPCVFQGFVQLLWFNDR